jgi:large subunit ribosomal protein L23
MNALARCARRSYATMPDAARAAMTSSSPKAVWLKRIRPRRQPDGKLQAPSLTWDPHTDFGWVDTTTSEGLTLREDALYRSAYAKGETIGEDGRELDAEEWLQQRDARRQRIRGIKGDRVVGQKVYLPNIVFKLTRNFTPPGQPYNPYEATFRLPHSITKADIRSYLRSVYGVQTTYIRTDNYFAPVKQLRYGRTKPLSHRSYKRAVVGLVEPFYYPNALEDMSEQEREERQKWIEQKFQTGLMDEMRAYEMLRLTRQGSKNWKWRGEATAKRGRILKQVMEARQQREAALAEVKQNMLRQRSMGRPVLSDIPNSSSSRSDSA